eukprot:15483568-Alexandrium_andersonii.AAC.1
MCIRDSSRGARASSSKSSSSSTKGPRASAGGGATEADAIGTQGWIAVARGPPAGLAGHECSSEGDRAGCGSTSGGCRPGAATAAAAAAAAGESEQQQQQQEGHPG